MTAAKIRIEPLTMQAFAQFGEVITVPANPNRQYFDGGLLNLRPAARPSLSLVRRDPSPLPLAATLMERHQFSSQTFIALDVGRWLVLVAPHRATGGPDMSLACAFLPAPGQGVTFGADVWHHPLTVFDRSGTFAIFMWRNSGSGDEEFHTLTQPVSIDLV